MKTAILAILLFGLLIFPHELGHFIAAKKCGVKVNEFAFGMGPAIWKKQRGETLHSIRLFPIGGYCALEGEDEDTGDPRAFVNKKPWQKLVVLASGAIMNFVICILILFFVYTCNGFTSTVISDVTVDSPAYEAGILAQDKIISIDGNKIKSWSEVGTYVTESEGEELTFVIRRDNEEISVTVKPELKERYLTDGTYYDTQYVIGVTSKISHNPFKAFIYSIKGTGSMFELMIESFKMLFSGEAGVKDLSGPIGVVQVVNEVSSYSIWSYFSLAAMISVNVGLINLFPLPALDGGRIIFVLYTMITKKKVNEKVEGTVHAIGLILLLGLSVFIAFNDIIKIVK